MRRREAVAASLRPPTLAARVRRGRDRRRRRAARPCLDVAVQGHRRHPEPRREPAEAERLQPFGSQRSRAPPRAPARGLSPVPSWLLLPATFRPPVTIVRSDRIQVHLHRIPEGGLRMQSLTSGQKRWTLVAGLARRVHHRRRQHGRKRRTPVHPPRPRARSERTRVDRQRLHPRLRHAAPHRRQARRSVRATGERSCSGSPSSPAPRCSVASRPARPVARRRARRSRASARR